MNASASESPEAILWELRARGMELAVANGKLLYRPVNAMTESLAAKVAANKQSIIELVSDSNNWGACAHALIATCQDASFRSDLRDLFEETAATLQFDQGRSAADAEMHAFGQLLFRILQIGLDARVAP